MANTPKPCDSCLYCGYNSLLKDDPNDEAYCKKELPMKDPCAEWKYWNSNNY